MSIPNLTDRNVSPKTTMYSNEPIPSNALAIAAARAKDVCDIILSSQIKQGIKKMSPDVMEIVVTLEALEGLDFWSCSAKLASEYSRPLVISSLLKNLEFCQPQIKKHGSIQKFLDYAETLIPVDENTQGN